MTRVAVSSSVFRWAMQRSGNPVELESKFPKLGEWLNGQSQPTLRQLESLSKATATPLGYFFLPEPPEERLSIPHFRTLDDRQNLAPSPDLLETVQFMERRQAWMREYLVDEGHEALPFVGSAAVTDAPDVVTRKMKTTLGLEAGWAAGQPNWEKALRELQRRMEAAGIVVVVNGVVGNSTRRKLSVTEFRGFVLVDEYCPLVFVNGADGKAAQMFTLAHELAHIWFGRSAAFDLRDLQPAADRTEQACNWVAAEFLVPADELRDFWPRVTHLAERYQLLARRFKVSELVAARRVLDLELVTRDEFLEFYQSYLEAVHQAAAKKPDGGDFYLNQSFRIGDRFGAAVVSAAREGRLLYREAYQLTGLYGNTFARYAELLDLGGLT